MSVQGTILVLDGVSTNRIMLKVQLTAAWYHIVQGEKLTGLMALLRRTRPDLVLTAQDLPDGTAADVKKLIMSEPDLADIPVVAIAQQNDRQARLRALADGMDDVLTQPYQDTLLLARVRSLLRVRADTQDLQGHDTQKNLGFAEPFAAFAMHAETARVAVVSHTRKTGALWQNALADCKRYKLSTHMNSNLHGLLSGSVPDALVVELGGRDDALNILADLRSRTATRHTVIIAVLDDDNALRASEALDRGADAVCLGGFSPEEIKLRLDNQIARKRRMDQMRASLRKGIAESRIDPLTGLYNRRYAMRAIAEIARRSAENGRGFAIMLADLDHFKSINDNYGHASGDFVLTQAARRMQSALGEDGFIARIGGEEFVIGVPDASRSKATKLASALCEAICKEPFRVPGQNMPIPVTVSIGLKLCTSTALLQEQKDPIDQLIQSADKALYAAKKAGRNRVTIMQSAA